MFFICAAPNEHIVRNTADTLETLQGLVEPFLEDLTANGETKWETAPAITPKWSCKRGQQARGVVKFAVQIARFQIADGELACLRQFWQNVYLGQVAFSVHV